MVNLSSFFIDLLVTAAADKIGGFNAHVMVASERIESHLLSQAIQQYLFSFIQNLSTVNGSNRYAYKKLMH